MATSNDRLRVPEGVSAVSTNVTLTNGGVVPVQTVHTKVQDVIKHRVELKSLTYNVTAAAGGAADGAGQKIMTLPVGAWLVLAARVDLTVTPQTGLSGASVIYGIGTAASGTDGALGTTEDDVLGELAFGDGTIAASTAETEQVIVKPGDGTTAYLLDGTAGAKDLYLNLAGTWTHASDVTGELVVAGTVELFLLDLGDV